MIIQSSNSGKFNQKRDEQFENEFSTMASEQEQREKSTEFLLEKMTQRIRDEICETKIEEHLKVSKLLITYELKLTKNVRFK